MSGVCLGVDGGGTKTLCVCVDIQNGAVLGSSEEGCTNWNSVGSDAAKHNLLSSFRQALKNANVAESQVKGVCLGMSGVDRPQDIIKVASWVKECFPSLEFTESGHQSNTILVENDAVAALASGTNGRRFGTVVISGTGMIVLAYTKDGKTHKRSGGWGPLLGDEGSGYAIGQDILKAVVRSHDGVLPQTELTSAVLNHLGLSKPEDLIGWAYNEQDRSWQKFAALAPLAAQCSSKGDKIALQILDTAANNLTINIVTAVKGLSMEKEAFPLVLAGGNLTHDNSKLAELVTQKVKHELPNVTIVKPSVNPATAAALLARCQISDQQK